jgi:Phosphoglyceromutase
MDGYGLGPPEPGNAIWSAETPELDRLISENPHTMLSASGEDVGLPAGQMGNSEVGHTNIGAGPGWCFRDLAPEVQARPVWKGPGSFFETGPTITAMTPAGAAGIPGT